MIHHCYVVPPESQPEGTAPPRGLRRAGMPSLVGLSALALLLSLAASLGAQAPRATVADTSAGRNFNWLGDRRTFVVGDIIRVAIDEYALATANKGTVNSASRRRKMDVGLEPPSVGSASGALGTMDGALQTGDAGESRQKGEATRGTRYVGELAARVVAVTPEGLLQIKGSKVIDVDKNKQTLTLTGFVRPQDVSSRDAVASTAVADAQLAYASKGGLGKPRNGILTRIVGLLWP